MPVALVRSKGQATRPEGGRPDRGGRSGGGGRGGHGGGHGGGGGGNRH
jgi:hypothetical protein